MRSEEEIRRLLRRLEEKQRECKETDYWADCAIKTDDGVYIFSECCEHDGIGEWIRALRWVLGEKVDPY